MWLLGDMEIHVDLLHVRIVGRSLLGRPLDVLKVTSLAQALEAAFELDQRKWLAGIDCDVLADNAIERLLVACDRHFAGDEMLLFIDFEELGDCVVLAVYGERYANRRKPIGMLLIPTEKTLRAGDYSYLRVKASRGDVEYFLETSGGKELVPANANRAQLPALSRADS